MQLQTREVNESYVEVLIDDIEIKIILTNFLSAYVEGYRFTPSFRCGAWDGKKKFYILTMHGMLVPKGLMLHLRKAMLKNEIDIQYKNTSEYMNITHEEFYEFISKLDLPFPPYDYQVDACVTFINKGRITAQLATGAGKSLVIYMLAMFFKANDMKSLVIVPSVSLVNQIRSDFDEYNFKEPELVHTMMAGIEKHFDCPISISTWQSLYNSPDLFSEIDVIMVDECLHPSTLISLENNEKEIKDIKVGDKVLTRNENTTALEYKTVLKIHKNLSSEKMFRIKMEDNSELLITGNHKVFTNNGWKRVDELNTNDFIIDKSLPGE